MRVRLLNFGHQKYIWLFIVWLLCSNDLFAQKPLKREFRGVWIASVANIDWPSRPDLSTEEQRDEFRSILNQHQKNGINAVIVQVRPSADAFYRSSFEPWSEWLTGAKAEEPDPEYDPLTFMIEESHERAMEFHAWLNPYRAIFDADKFYKEPGHVRLDTLNSLIKELIESDSANDAPQLSGDDYNDLVQLLDLDTGILVYQHPEWFVQYGNKIYFDPGIPEVQNHIYNVVGEIVEKYDVDAIHMDDYFYPYRIAGVEFPDSASFKKYGSTYSVDLKDFWRRENVNTIVKNLNETIKARKPYVKFGISPFGVWRNASVDPAGSNTKAGQTNYDDLYADVLKWQKEKWIDYVIPQIYWHRGFNLADYEILAHWWNDNSYGVHIYIGQGLYRVDAESPTEAWRNPLEIPEQIDLNRSLPNIQGSCFFSSKTVINNPLGVSDILREKYYQFPALIPEMDWIKVAKSDKPKNLEVHDSKRGFIVEWQGSTNADYYVVYRFKGTKAGDVHDPSNIIAIQRDTSPFLYDQNIRKFRKYTYVVTSLNRLYEESATSEPVTTKWKRFKNR
jgi:uncharacterized lipoprotein YddW (UPF0748 family)